MAPVRFSFKIEEAIMISDPELDDLWFLPVLSFASLQDQIACWFGQPDIL